MISRGYIVLVLILEGAAPMALRISESSLDVDAVLGERETMRESMRERELR